EHLERVDAERDRGHAAVTREQEHQHAGEEQSSGAGQRETPLHRTTSMPRRAETVVRERGLHLLAPHWTPVFSVTVPPKAAPTPCPVSGLQGSKFSPVGPRPSWPARPWQRWPWLTSRLSESSSVRRAWLACAKALFCDK